MEVKKFIEKNIDLIENNNWKELYDIALNRWDGLSASDIGLFSQMMLQADINPLEYLEKVPLYFLYGCTDIKVLSIPENIKYIGEDAFYNCSLEYVKIPTTVVDIGDDAFSLCSSLKAINLEDINFFNRVRFRSIASNPFCQLTHRPKLVINNIPIEELGYILNIEYNLTTISREPQFNFSLDPINRYDNNLTTLTYNNNNPSIVYYPSTSSVYVPDFYKKA